MRIQDNLASKAENELIEWEEWFCDDPPEEVKREVERALREATKEKMKQHK